MVGTLAGRQAALLQFGSPRAIGQRRAGSEKVRKIHAATSLRARATAATAFSP